PAVGAAPCNAARAPSPGALGEGASTRTPGALLDGSPKQLRSLDGDVWSEQGFWAAAAGPGATAPVVSVPILAAASPTVAATPTRAASGLCAGTSAIAAI